MLQKRSGVTLITTNESIGHTNQDDDHHLEEHDGQDLDDQSHDTESTQNDKHLENTKNWRAGKSESIPQSE